MGEVSIDEEMQPMINAEAYYAETDLRHAHAIAPHVVAEVRAALEARTLLGDWLTLDEKAALRNPRTYRFGTTRT